MDAIMSWLPCLGHWRSKREQDPERQPIFPPPNTILTPPRRPTLPHVHSGGEDMSTKSELSSPTTSLHPYRLYTTLTSVQRERIGSISRAYQGRMLSLDPNSRSNSTASSTINTPHATQIRFFQPHQHHHHRHHSQQDSPDIITHRDRAPSLGRSASEPRSLAVLGMTAGMDAKCDFASHQIPKSSPAIVLRGRPRSATTTVGHLRQDEPLALPEGMMRTSSRGRSPGPSRLGRSASVGEVPALNGHRPIKTEVIKMELGIRDLADENVSRRGRSRRGRSINPRGRRVTS